MDPLLVVDREKVQTTGLRNMLAGRAALLIGGGPSLRSVPVEKLKRRGVFSMGINNVAAYAPVSSFVFSDPPEKFHDGIWLDPTIMKFVPMPKLTREHEGVLRTFRDSKFEILKAGERLVKTADCPNVWGFAVRKWWAYDSTFFSEVEATVGNNAGGHLRTGNPKTLCTLLLGLRLLHYLGASAVFLVGVDFHMEHGDEYAFNAVKKPEASVSNNHQYAVVNDGLCKMAADGVFERAGLEVYNCNQNSRLRAFSYVSFDDAVQYVLKDFPQNFDLSRWYDK